MTRKRRERRGEEQKTDNVEKGRGVTTLVFEAGQRAVVEDRNPTASWASFWCVII